MLISIRQFVVFFAAAVIIGVCIVPRAEEEPKDGVQILFIGNSFTYYHDMPKMVAELAKAGKQRPLVMRTEVPGGYTLQRHWKEGTALAKLQSRKWDFVVLQDQSQAPLLARESMFEYGAKFDEEIKKQEAKTVLYLTWAMQNQPEDQKKITEAYEELGKKLDAKVAPVGKAWQQSLADDSKRTLHDPDQKHPSRTGSYLAACVFYATIYGKSPEGLPGSIGGLSDDEARKLQVIAWKVVNDGK